MSRLYNLAYISKNVIPGTPEAVKAEIRDILEVVTRPAQRVKLGSLLSQIGREVGLTDKDCIVFDQVRDKTPSDPVSFE